MATKKAKKKRPKLDNNFVSSQDFEIQYIASKFKIRPALVRKFKKEIGRSRKAIYSAIRNYLADK